MSLEGEHMRKVKTKLRSNWGIIKGEGGKMLHVFQKRVTTGDKQGRLIRQPKKDQNSRPCRINGNTNNNTPDSVGPSGSTGLEEHQAINLSQWQTYRFFAEERLAARMTTQASQGRS